MAFRIGLMFVRHEVLPVGYESLIWPGGGLFYTGAATEEEP